MASRYIVFPSLLFALIRLTSTAESLLITVCDCEKPVIKGIMDVSDPFYCKLNSTDDYNGIGKNFSYKIVTKPSPTLIWKGFSCSQWIETKIIEGFPLRHS